MGRKKSANAENAVLLLNLVLVGLAAVALATVSWTVWSSPSSDQDLVGADRTGMIIKRGLTVLANAVFGQLNATEVVVAGALYVDEDVYLCNGALTNCKSSAAGLARLSLEQATTSTT